MRIRFAAAALMLGTLLFVPAMTAHAQTATRTVTDSAGRKVTIPAEIKHVFAAGSPAAITLFTLVPDKLAGWPDPLSDESKQYLPPRYAALPVTGRLTGRANTANVESVLAAKPDIVIDIGTIAPIYASLADRVQEQTGIPYLLLDGSLEHSAELYEQLGAILGAPEKAKELAAYARDTLTSIKNRLSYVPRNQKTRVYYARGPQGFETGLAGSINAEMLDFVGAVNVAVTGEKRNIATISPEQILAWNPDVIVTVDPRFFASVGADPIWQDVAAVRYKRIYLAPNRPFGWFDSPPAVNRLIGLRWLCAKLYPGLFLDDLRPITRDFYQRFYHIELSDPQLDALLGPAAS